MNWWLVHCLCQQANSLMKLYFKLQAANLNQCIFKSDIMTSHLKSRPVECNRNTFNLSIFGLKHVSVTYHGILRAWGKKFTHAELQVLLLLYMPDGRPEICTFPKIERVSKKEEVASNRYNDSNYVIVYNWQHFVLSEWAFFFIGCYSL